MEFPLILQYFFFKKNFIKKLFESIKILQVNFFMIYIVHKFLVLLKSTDF